MSVVLYISYDGLCEPLGQSQVYQYLIGLGTQYGYKFHLITFEKPSDLRNKDMMARLKKELSLSGVTWYPLRYHKTPSLISTAYDVGRGLLVAIYVLIRMNIRVVHVRSYVPAIIALVLRVLAGKPFVFDMRGFWVDEKVDVGAWPRGGVLHRVGKWFEMWFLLKARVIISLTDAAIVEMRKFPYLVNKPAKKFFKISTCVNLSLFKPGSLAKREPVIGYVGGASAWYDLDLAIKYFLEIKRRVPGAQFLIINTNEHDHILKRLGHFNIGPSDFRLLPVQHQDMPAYLRQMNIAVFFIRPFFSKIASAPTKLGELLACGIPCITGEGIGDMTNLLREENVGLVLVDHSEEAIQKSAAQALDFMTCPHIRKRCVDAAEKYFSLSQALKQYDYLYSKEVDDYN